MGTKGLSQDIPKFAERKIVDHYGLARDLTKPKSVGHWGNGDYQASFEKMEDLDRILELVKQSYEFNK